ncbi:MAG: glutaminase A [Acidobacteriota bacterium]|nr:MAG: glutaminase A [Acidobacteriota bacterium]
MKVLKIYIHLLLFVLFIASPHVSWAEEAFSAGTILPTSPQEIEQTLSEMHQKYMALKDGEVYISGTEQVNPDWFGIAIATVDGRVHMVGNADTPFPIQSIAKPFVYGLALEDHGREIMLKKVGVNATGLPYDSIIASTVRAKQLQNPMVSAGAIATTSLIKGSTAKKKWARVRRVFSRYAGHTLPLNEQVYQAEMKQSAMSRALAELLSAYHLLYAKVDDTIALYLKGTSQSVTAKDLAIMGATLANWGANPLTQERAIKEKYVQNILSAMVTAGLYDDSGEWLFKVGLPGKSGVGGGIVAVVPGRFAVAVYSPPLDSSGNSVRGVHVVQDLSNRWDLHMFSPRREESR